MAEDTATDEETTADEAGATDAPAVDVDTTPEAADSSEAPTGDEDRSARKVREGTVVSNKMDKTAVVAVVSRVRHAKYNKMILQTKKLYAHDETNDVNIGDKVRVMETRALSKNKRWRVIDVLERAR